MILNLLCHVDVKTMGFLNKALNKAKELDEKQREYFEKEKDNLKKSRGVIKMDKIEVFGRLTSKEEIEHVFLKAKRLQAQNRVYEEELQKFRSVGV